MREIEGNMKNPFTLSSIKDSHLRRKHQVLHDVRAGQYSCFLPAARA